MTGNPELDSRLTGLLFAVLASVIAAGVIAFARWAHGQGVERARYHEERDRHEREMSETLEAVRAQTEMVPAIAQGTRSLLRSELVGLHRKWVERSGYITLEAKEYASRTYADYHALGGNGVGTKLYEDLMALPLREGDETPEV